MLQYQQGHTLQALCSQEGERAVPSCTGAANTTVSMCTRLGIGYAARTRQS